MLMLAGECSSYPPPFFYVLARGTSRHYLPFDVVQGRSVCGVGKFFFIVALLEVHATPQNSPLLHVQLEFGYQGDL